MKKTTLGIALATAGFLVLTPQAASASRAQSQGAYNNDGRLVFTGRNAQPQRARKRTRRWHVVRGAGHREHHRLFHTHVAHAHGDGRPAAWCGWWLRQKLGIADVKYNLARNWKDLGRASSAHDGVVVVWAHHVGRIVRVTRPGFAIVESGNDGHRVRVRERSIKNAIAFREM